MSGVYDVRAGVRVMRGCGRAGDGGWLGAPPGDAGVAMPAVSLVTSVPGTGATA